jgi:two-component system response regulator RegX3
MIPSGSDRKMTVLVVEDEESYVQALEAGLEREGFRVRVARDGVEALALFGAVHPDIVLLDLMLPGIPGLDVCRQLRSRSSVPIIMVTAKDAELDAIVGLEVGADDYVSKPYRIRELVARMRAVLRRSPANDDAGTDALLTVGELMLDQDRHEVRLRGRPVELPLREFEVLEVLMANAGRVVTRDALLDRVWGPGYQGEAKTIDVHIKRLRGRIEDDPANPSRITTIRGLGYRFEDDRPH